MPENTASDKLPESLKSLFWDCDFDGLSLGEYKSFILRRVLDEGGWDAIIWLRATVGDSALAEWIMSGQGRKLSPRRLRFWQLVLHLPADQIDDWVRQARESVWEKRYADQR